MIKTWPKIASSASRIIHQCEVVPLFCYNILKVEQSEFANLFILTRKIITLSKSVKYNRKFIFWMEKLFPESRNSLCFYIMWRNRETTTKIIKSIKT